MNVKEELIRLKERPDTILAWFEDGFGEVDKTLFNEEQLLSDDEGHPFYVIPLHIRRRLGAELLGIADQILALESHLNPT